MDREELDTLQNAIAKVKQIVEGKIPSGLVPRTLIYNEIYEKCYKVPRTLMQAQYEKTLEDHINSTVAPALRGKEDELLLKEVRKQWEYYNRMVSILLKWVFFKLARKYSMIFSKPDEAAQRYFNEVLRSNVQAAIMLQINKVREGESILDGTVLNNVLRMLLDLGMDISYSRKAASWIWICEGWKKKQLQCIVCIRVAKLGM
ncbi:cullin-1-like [Cryptomeria japonica]|uniref:cullin-1-like n=1 Tax=Cryptomeria japonica TaxID=3369 RepID=UPI0027DA5AA6|nr:cullin-1-like [Cryptomeria japonica]